MCKDVQPLVVSGLMNFVFETSTAASIMLRMLLRQWRTFVETSVLTGHRKLIKLHSDGYCVSCCVRKYLMHAFPHM